MQIFLINGYPGAGKDTFVELCSNFCSVENILTSTPAKEALKLLGWDGEKTNEARDLLSDLIDSSYRLWDGPTKYVLEQVDRSAADAAFIHCREPENLERLSKLLPGCLTIFVSRDEAAENAHDNLENHADLNVESYDYDIWVTNEGSLEDLKEVTKFFVKEYII